jgi:hypothetical protein
MKPRRLQLVPHVARMGETRAYRVFVAKCLHISTWNEGDGEDNIKTDLTGINYEDQRWMELADV